MKICPLFFTSWSLSGCLHENLQKEQKRRKERFMLPGIEYILEVGVLSLARWITPVRDLEVKEGSEFTVLFSS